ncbi:ThuA domain-containing protein [Chitinophaga sp. SYP-B3965]|uniref:ThuA domain-containing protein n=1 Tax=Chitinophaga sp. SYP-B3965 TaxID=2663120 RepID=UPI001C129BFF|nr:ThuA domain-containing protein [Chitinophaga sp. SYP-B3965]
MMSYRFSRLLVYVFLFSCLACKTTGKMESSQVNWKKIQVLLYTKNGKGYVHDNIPNAVAAFQKMGKEHGFTVDVSDTPTVFTDENLHKYAALVFISTNNEVFDTDQQKVAFMRYIQSGGGFMGVHSAIGTERSWTWFKQLLGGTFSWHARSQSFKVNVIDAAHPSVKDVPKVWTRFDECYFSKELYPGIKVVMAHDVSSLNPNQDSLIKKNMGSYGNLYPAVWYQDFDGGHVWFSALGHHKEDYEKADLVNHLYQGLHWLVAQTTVRDLSKAYATSPQTPVRY